MVHAVIATLLATLRDALGLRTATHAAVGANASAPNDPRRYRLRTWPELPDPLRVAPMYRILSTMSVQPVTRGWMESQPGVKPLQLRSLLDFLERGHALETMGAVT